MLVPITAELILLITAESDIASGLALAERLRVRNDYATHVLVVSDKPAALVERVKLSIASDTEGAHQVSLETVGTNIDALLAQLNQANSLRILLLPGLDQLNDNRKLLLRKIHATVVCFEAHPGLLTEPNRLCLVGEEESNAATWMCEQLLSRPELVSTSLEEIQAAAVAPRVEPAAHGEADWVLLAAKAKAIDAASRRAKAVIEAAVGPVLLVRGGDSWVGWLMNRYLPQLAAKYAPQMSREDRRQLASDLSTFSKLDFDFVALICAASFLASFGLVQDSAAVIIGAMLIAPLMTPILGAGLSLTQGNRPLFAKSLRTIAIGFLAALATSTLFGLLIRFIPNSILQHTNSGVVLTGEMWSRTSPTIIDFLVGLVGGSAAAYARTRNHLSAALAGAAIAAALVPPIATAGLQISLVFQQIEPPALRSGASHLIYGPMLLFLANMLTIMIGSSFVLWACGVRGEHTHSTKERWTTRMTILLMLLTVVVAVWIVQHP